VPGRSDVAYWDSVAAQSDALPAGWRHHARRAHLDLIGRWIGRPTGRWLKTDLYEERSADRSLLEDLDTARWTGVDVSPATAGQARATVGGSVAVTDLRRAGLASAAFDGVLSTSTLDHFDDAVDLGAALAEIHRVLAPGGRLVLTLDNPANPLIRARNALPRGVARRTGLVPFAVGHTVGAPAGAGLLTEVGFRVERVEHLLHAPHVIGTRPARWRWYERRVLPRIDRLAATRLAPFTGHYVAFLASR
jgi:SAM-dependent methyltransferase